MIELALSYGLPVDISKNIARSDRLSYRLMLPGCGAWSVLSWADAAAVADVVAAVSVVLAVGKVYGIMLGRQ